ncbi:hypothetical protein FRC02_010951 [Tulasnella sp. 418]|nr:hypothetical protein FRC02_010951 [Tulasnella sp. 418]
MVVLGSFIYFSSRFSTRGVNLLLINVREKVILASIVTKTPHSNLAPSSMHHLDLVLNLFKAAKSGSRPARTLPMLLKIHQKALDVYTEYQNNQGTSPTSSGTSGKEASPSSERDDQLEPMLGAKTRLVKKQQKSGSRKTTKGSTASINMDCMAGAHPNLMEHYQFINKTPSNSPQPNLPHLQAGLCPAEPQIMDTQIPSAAAAYQPLGNLGSNIDPIQSPFTNLGTTYPGVQFELPGTPYGSLDFSRSQQSTRTANPEAVFTQNYGNPSTSSDMSSGLWQFPTQTTLQSVNSQFGYSAVPLAPPGVGPPISYAQQQESFFFGNAAASPMTAQGSSGHGGHSMQSNQIGGLIHPGGVGELDQGWRSFLTQNDMPLAPIPQQPS